MMDSDDLLNIGYRLQDVDHRTFRCESTERTALIAHLHDLSDLLVRIGGNENQGRDDTEEAAAIIKVIGMDQVLDTTLADAYSAAEELQRILELANVGTKRNRYPVIGRNEEESE